MWVSGSSVLLLQSWEELKRRDGVQGSSWWPGDKAAEAVLFVGTADCYCQWKPCLLHVCSLSAPCLLLYCIWSYRRLITFLGFFFFVTFFPCKAKLKQNLGNLFEGSHTSLWGLCLVTSFLTAGVRRCHTSQFIIYISSGLKQSTSSGSFTTGGEIEHCIACLIMHYIRCQFYKLAHRNPVEMDGSMKYRALHK